MMHRLVSKSEVIDENLKWFLNFEKIEYKIEKDSKNRTIFWISCNKIQWEDVKRLTIFLARFKSIEQFDEYQENECKKVCGGE